MLRAICIAVVIVGSVATAYAAWSWYRISPSVLVHDDAWPRPSPFPDRSLLALNDWFDMRYPAPGMIKIHGEIGRVRLTIAGALVVSVGLTTCAGIPLAWPWLRHLRSFEVSLPGGRRQA